MTDTPQPDSEDVVVTSPRAWIIIRPGVIKYAKTSFTIRHYEDVPLPYLVYRQDKVIFCEAYRTLGDAKKRVIEYHAELIAMGLET